MSKVLVGLDESNGARAALRWAAAVATARNARLVALTAWQYPASTPLPWSSPDLPSVDEADHKVRAAARAIVDDELGPDAPEVEISVQHGPAATALRSTASDGAGMLVVGSRGLGGFDGLLLGSVSRQLADQPPCPLVIVRNLVTDAAPTKILAGIDGSAGAADALRWAADLASTNDGEVIALHVTPTSTIVPTPPDDEKARAETHAHLAGDWTDLLRGAHVPHRVVDRDGDPRAVLLAAAEDMDADLVVIGARGTSLISHAVLGSVSNHVVQHSTRPVAVVPPGWAPVKASRHDQ